LGQKKESFDGAQTDTSGVHVWLVLWKAFSALYDQAEQSIRALGIIQSDFRVLEALLHKGPLPVNTIGPLVQLTSGSISVAVDRLEEKELVKRQPDKEDRRKIIVLLTAKGRTLIEKAFAVHAEAMEKATEGLSKPERAEVIFLLKKLGKHARGDAAQSES
jgi:MarR family transcriptional regulator, 2-MHQ and catechol-resistance regulon repressor